MMTLRLSTSCMLSQVHRFTHCQRQPLEGSWQGRASWIARIGEREMGSGRVRPQATSLCLEPPEALPGVTHLALGRDTLGYLVPAVRGSLGYCCSASSRSFCWFRSRAPLRRAALPASASSRHWTAALTGRNPFCLFPRARAPPARGRAGLRLRGGSPPRPLPPARPPPPPPPWPTGPLPAGDDAVRQGCGGPGPWEAQAVDLSSEPDHPCVKGHGERKVGSRE